MDADGGKSKRGCILTKHSLEKAPEKSNCSKFDSHDPNL